ncbi:MAG: hypothetical protein ACYTFQ_09920 [Planctomycetota bacterium]|jgi:hypothetical protein
MKHLLVGLSVCLLASTAHGTAQIPEKLLYKGKEYRLTSLPLEKYFDAERGKPKQLRPTSTACWRGYVGTWEVTDKTLYLKSLGRYRGGGSYEEIPFSVCFKDRKPPIMADWFTGALRLPQGKMLRYVHMDFESIYEKDLYIGIRKGKVVSETLIDNKGKGATRSTSDLQWVALAPKPVRDDFKWTDARVVASEAFLRFKESGKSFCTRGIYYGNYVAESPRLRIPQTPTTRPVTILLDLLPEDYTARAGQHVEIKAHYEKDSGDYSLHVDSIRPLKPGETMHHPNFKPPAKPEQKKP